MAKASFPSDTITFKASTGGNSAGNGGDGYNKGDISNNPSVKFEPTNKAEGGDIYFKASIESANLNDVLNHSKYFDIDDFLS